MLTESYGYVDFSQFLSRFFPFKVQKIAINAGFTCPNRDGTKGYGGCTYCNNQTFNPGYCTPVKSVRQQLDEGRGFFSRKYPSMKYLAYFQAYTNTYGQVSSLMQMYRDALAVEGVGGIIIGTRPDCMPQPLLDELELLARETFVLVEYGVETSHDATLQLINRGHTWADTVDAVRRTATAGIMCGAHIIIGLPGETESQIMATADAMASLPLSTLKIHQLQLIKGTRMAQQVAEGTLAVPSFTPQSYVALCGEFIKHLPLSIAIERFVSQSPDSLLVSPRWGLKNYQFANLLNNYLRDNCIRQGSLVR